MKFTLHPVVELFPTMDEESYRSLKLDIQKRGLILPIVTLPDGQVIDGRHRFIACQELGIEPEHTVYEGPTDTPTLAQHAMSLNGHRRRHLTKRQLAAIAAELANMISGARTDLASNEARSGVSESEAAEIMRVSRSSVQRAKRRMREEPEAHEAVKRGEKIRAEPKTNSTKAANGEPSSTEPSDLYARIKAMIQNLDDQSVRKLLDEVWTDRFGLEIPPFLDRRRQQKPGTASEGEVWA